MTDTPAANGSATLRAQFSKNALLPRRQIAQANRFIEQLHAFAAKGEKPSPQDLKAGEQLLEKIENQLTIVGFNAVQLTVMEHRDGSDMERKLDAIVRGIDQAQATSDRLRDTLKSFS